MAGHGLTPETGTDFVTACLTHLSLEWRSGVSPSAHLAQLAGYRGRPVPDLASGDLAGEVGGEEMDGHGAPSDLGEVALTTPILQEPIKDPARFPWHEVVKVQHYWLEVDAMTTPMTVRERGPDFTV